MWNFRLLSRAQLRAREGRVQHEQATRYPRPAAGYGAQQRGGLPRIILASPFPLVAPAIAQPPGLVIEAFAAADGRAPTAPGKLRPWLRSVEAAPGAALPTAELLPAVRGTKLFTSTEPNGSVRDSFALV